MNEETEEFAGERGSRLLIVYAAGFIWPMIATVGCIFGFWAAGLRLAFTTSISSYAIYCLSILAAGKLLSKLHPIAALFVSFLLFVVGSYICCIVGFVFEELFSERPLSADVFVSALAFAAVPVVFFSFITVPIVIVQTLLVRWAYAASSGKA